jgi:hypothetical protein
MICTLVPTSDPNWDPGFVAFLTPGSEIQIRDPGWKNLDPDPESGMNIIFPSA